MAELTLVDSHFRFGENWADFALGIDDARIAQAQEDLCRLLGRDSLSGLSFLDIGSGSGLHSLAALRMGAAEVTAVDIDSQSVATTRTLLSRHAPGGPWSVELGSIFDFDPSAFERRDIVYSWGVLHHTGAMFEAIKRAAALVAARGRFCVALYGRTALCGFWRGEKQVYSRAPRAVQSAIRGVYIGAFWLVQSLRGGLRGRRFRLRRYVQDYPRSRGMSFHNDVHDWLGGYPYESVRPDELRSYMRTLGFVEERSFIQPGVRHGLFGAGCDEYVFCRSGS